MTREELNEVYKKLEVKTNELIAPLTAVHKGFPYTCGYYSGHYYKNIEGKYEMDFFPIPVISVINICDVEINIDVITVSTKLKRENALNYDYTQLNKFTFEAYGVENYLDDYYIEGGTYSDLINNVKESEEKEIGFSFIFENDLSGQKMYELIKFLRKEGFYY